MINSTAVPTSASTSTSSSESAPASRLATRLNSPSRIKDPKLVTGVALIALSMILGSWIVGSADQRTPVWALKSPLAAGSVLEPGDLIELPISADNVASYVQTDQSIDGMRLTRDMGGHEFLPQSALTGDAQSRRLVTIPVALEHGAATAARGDKVDVLVSERDASGGIRSSRVILSSAVIAEVNPNETGNGEVPIVLEVSPDQVPALVGALRGGVLDLVRVGA